MNIELSYVDKSEFEQRGHIGGVVKLMRYTGVWGRMQTNEYEPNALYWRRGAYGVYVPDMDKMCVVRVRYTRWNKFKTNLHVLVTNHGLSYHDAFKVLAL